MSSLREHKQGPYDNVNVVQDAYPV